MDTPRTRLVTLVLTDGRGALLGALPPFEVATPWWQEVADVVEGAREAFGLDVVVLRLLVATGDGVTDGGDVTYLAEFAGPAGPAGPALPLHDVADAVRRLPLTPWTGPDPLVDHPRRAPWARPGGPTADLRWALDAVGGPSTSAEVEQVRSWNLSSLWRVPTPAGRAWLKVVPSFFAHEVAVLRALQGTGAVPALIAGEVGPGYGRMLLAAAPSDDATAERSHRVRRGLAALVPLQVTCAGRLQELADAGVPDRRDDADVVDAVARTLDANRAALSDEDRDAARALVRDLPALLAAERAAGLPDTLVHGDFHVGNVLGAGDRAVVIDWGDSSLGQPARDVVRMVEWLPAEARGEATAFAVEVWDAAWPGVDLAAALPVARVMNDLLGATAWQGFLDRIEPDERVYHAGDPPVGLASGLERYRALG